MIKQSAYIGLDFDGTCVEHRFPLVGPDVPGAVDVLSKIVAKGHKLILFTMRSDVINPMSNDPNIVAEPGNYLQDALDWFEDKRIPLYGIQRNPDQDSWTSSPKAYAHLYIDDAALGCPLIYPKDGSRPYVNWAQVDILMQAKGLL